MPIYEYECDTCGHKADEFFPMTTKPLLHCPVCHEEQYHRRPSLSHTSMKEFATPIEMYSVAMDHDEDIRVFQQRAPDVQVSCNQNDPMYGIPIAASRHQKLQALKAAGFQETK